MAKNTQAPATEAPATEATESKVTALRNLFLSLSDEEALEVCIAIHNEPFLYHIFNGGKITEKPNE